MKAIDNARLFESINSLADEALCRALARLNIPQGLGLAIISLVNLRVRINRYWIECTYRGKTMSEQEYIDVVAEIFKLNERMGDMKKLWLDDVRPAPSSSWIWVRDYDDALAMLASHDDFSVISVGAKAGYDVVCWIEEQILNGDMNIPDEISCHSENPAGKRRIELAISKLNERMGDDENEQ